MSFLRNFLNVQGKQAVQAVNDALVRVDPEAAIQADLDTMSQDVDKAGQVISKLRADLTREQKEGAAVDARYSELMGAAENIKGQIDNQETPADRRASLEASLSRLLDQIEKIVPQRDREHQDIEQTQALLTEAEAAYKEKVQALTEAKSTLTRARQDMQHSAIREERAAQRARQAEVVAGLKATPTSQLTVALASMQRATDAANQRTEAANMKAQALAGARDQEEDPNIKEAIAASKGQPSGQSLADRLAALRK